MTAVDLALPRLKTEEGFRAAVYRDTQGHQTIGYGFNLDAGISKVAAESLLIAQAQERHDALLKFPWYAALDPVRQSVCLDVAFNNGLHGLLEFVHMLSALAKQDWEGAAAELLNSKAANLLPARYQSLANILRTGVST